MMPIGRCRCVLTAVLLAAMAVATPAASSEPADASGSPSTSTERARLDRLATGAMRKFRFEATPTVIPDPALLDAELRPRRLSEWRGKTLLVNFWATWCPPCREEMPHLDRLRQRLGGADFDVITVSVDREGVDAAGFLRTLGLPSLPLLRDPGARASPAFGVVGMPTSLLVDRHGRLVGRLEGSADWSAAEAILLVKAVILDRATAAPP